MKKRRYVIRKYVEASSAAEAIEKESATPVSDVYLEEPSTATVSTYAVGFMTYPES